MNQGLEALDQATKAAARYAACLINHFIQITDQIVHLLQSYDQPEIHGVQTDACVLFQCKILKKLVDLQPDGGNHLFLAPHPSLEYRTGDVGLPQSLQAFGI